MRSSLTPPHARVLLSCLLLGLGVSVLALPVPAHATVAEGEEAGRMVLVLDSSGSMKEQAGGTTKIQAAKEALGLVVEQLPEDAEVGIRVFGAEVFDRSKPGACTDSQNVVPVGPLDRGALTAAVADYQPYGETPIGHALGEAAKDLGPGAEGERRTIVLLSDGEPTCQPDPCKVAERLAKQGVDLAINVVGLDVSGKAREALQCIARAGNGDYYDAGSADELANSLIKVSVRDLRGFRLTGERVEGGTTPQDALPIEPGTYVDTSLPEEGLRYYLVDRPEGGGVSFSALVRPPKGDENWNTVVSVSLLTPDGQRCAHSYAQSLQVLGMTPLTSTAVTFNPFAQTRLASEECVAAPQLLAAVSSKAGVGDYRLQVSTQPAVQNADALPGPVADEGDWIDVVDVATAGPREPVVGGVNFDDAPELVPGTTYSDSLRPSEVLVYKVRAGYGQAVRLSASLGTDPQAASVVGLQGPHVTLHSYSGLGQRLTQVNEPDKGVRSSEFYNGGEPRLLTAVVPPIRVRNVESPQPGVRTLIQDGYQYFALGMARAVSAQDAQFAAPVTISAELVGEVEGEPEYAGDVAGPGDEGAAAAEDGGTSETPDQSSNQAAVESDDPAPVVWWTLGGLGVLLLAAAAVVLVRRSRA
ncbi:vWA domain-containing protein [Nocardioides houyundeii]|uniref:vWA domain-containing protein n=1 Tax=Nocardioides houyundeii TaxID=2045452 RepID=UPI000C78635C|nr:VWA domain-containing protein [Nocardioides houyundeii]